MTVSRKRLSPEESRTSALIAARELLIEAGPQAVTLKAVAGRIGRTHANLLHHFGSASGLQKELARYLSETICETIGATVLRTRTGDASTREIVDLTFDAFDREGAGALASWMLLSGNEDALDPIVESIHNLIHDLDEEDVEACCGPQEFQARHEETLMLVLMALGDSLLGQPLAGALGLSRDTARAIAERNLTVALEQPVLENGEA